jgi:type VI secretion system secreted protein Hcp
MGVTGEVQGESLGSVDISGREGTIAVYGFGHNLRLPVDPNTEMPSGKRQHSPLEVLKEFDKSSPI